jgi:hypothetical protein
MGNKMFNLLYFLRVIILNENLARNTFRYCMQALSSGTIPFLVLKSDEHWETRRIQTNADPFRRLVFSGSARPAAFRGDILALK